MKKYISLLCCFFISFYLSAQKYSFPVNNGQKCILSGNFAEIRGSHFHTGLDIAIDENTPVKSIAAGYVYKIKVSTYGYGKVLYIKHPSSGHVSVYAHLSGFNQSISNFIRQVQTSKQSFEVEIELEPNKIPVSQNEIVAFSGNSGYSFGPHLHFEIRDQNNIALNPSKFGFSELPKDNIAPVLNGLAVTAMDIQARVNRQFGSFTFEVLAKGKNKYTLKSPIEVWGRIGFEAISHDLANSSSNTYGTTNMEVKVDGKRIFYSDFNKISIDDNSSADVHIDFLKFRVMGKDYQRCYVADGNRFVQNYQHNADKGCINIRDEGLHQVEITATDVWGNSSVLSFNVKGKRPPDKVDFVKDASPMKALLHTEIRENTLLIAASFIKEEEAEAKLDFGGILIQVPLAYTVGKTNYYLWDLRKGLPDAVYVGKNKKYFAFKMLIPSDQNFYFESREVELNIPKKCLYDTLYLEVKNDGVYLDINNPHIPLFAPLKIAFKTPFKGKQFGVYSLSSSNSFLGGAWSIDRISFECKNLGRFKIMADNIKPAIQLLQKSANKISFRISDDLSGIKDFKAKINGQFIIMDYEYKTKTIWTETKNQPLKGTFELEVEDAAGNKAIYTTKL